MDVAELVEAEEVEPAVAGDQARERALVGGLGQFVHELCRRRVAHPQPALAGGHAEADQQMRLAGTAVAEQHDGLALGDPLAALQRGEHGRVDGRRRRQVEVGEVLEAWGSAASRMRRSRRRSSAVVEFGLEHLGEVGEMAEPLAQRGLGERGGLLAHGREVQLPAGRLDRQRRRLLGHGRAHRALPASSAS